MNAEALIGTVLGTCELQQVIGQGGMGAVYLAQQSRPRRQVAVKVLLPLTPLPRNQLAAFLERFRRETDAVASLEHPNIIPVYEYGEYNGLAYLVMPFISGGTLRDVLERDGALPLPKLLSYLEQMAAALDFAHERKVIHRDVKPANMLLTPQERLLLTDFGLVKVSGEKQEGLKRLTGPGAPVGTPDYMSPEQVLGENIDGRADLYSLGVILYQMVTGTMPFQGETPMQIAAQHLHVSPNSPRLLRPDLPVAAEQVILRAMSKRPADRYPGGQDLAEAFRTALNSSGVLLTGAGMTHHAPTSSSTTEDTGGILAPAKGVRPFKPGGLFDPSWQTGAMKSLELSGGPAQSKPTGILPAASASPVPSTGLLSAYKTRPAAMMDDMIPSTPLNALSTTSSSPIYRGSAQPAMPARETGQTSSKLSAFFPPQTTDALPADPGIERASSALGIIGQEDGTATGPMNQAPTNTVKLTGPVKVVQVPIAGQPGRYVTGLLPVAPQIETPATEKAQTKNRLKIVAFVVAALLVLGFGSGTFWFVHTHSSPTTKTVTAGNTVVVGTPNMQATVATQATATASANVILSDPLSQNIHNWPTTPTANATYAFINGAYHITNLGDRGTAVVLQSTSFNMPIGYTLTMEEIKGDETSLNNSFGMILRSNVQNKGGRVVSTFYSFEVVNTPGGEYRFYKYDDSSGATGSAWTELWHQPFGGEFHQGHGPKSINTLKIWASGSKFTFTVNGKLVGSTSDHAIASGGVGMLVNLKGTEVAFSNMLITRS